MKRFDSIGFMILEQFCLFQRLLSLLCHELSMFQVDSAPFLFQLFFAYFFLFQFESSRALFENKEVRIDFTDDNLENKLELLRLCCSSCESTPETSHVILFCVEALLGRLLALVLVYSNDDLICRDHF